MTGQSTLTEGVEFRLYEMRSSGPKLCRDYHPLLHSGRTYRLVIISTSLRTGLNPDHFALVDQQDILITSERFMPLAQPDLIDADYLAIEFRVFGDRMLPVTRQLVVRYGGPVGSRATKLIEVKIAPEPVRQFLAMFALVAIVAYDRVPDVVEGAIGTSWWKEVIALGIALVVIFVVVKSVEWWLRR